MVAMQPDKNNQNTLQSVQMIDGIKPPEPQAPQAPLEEPNPVPVQDEPGPISREPKHPKSKFPFIAVTLAVIIVAGLAAAAIMLGLRQNSAQGGALPRTMNEDTSGTQSEITDKPETPKTTGSPVIDISE
jgi:hypothetical protein